MKSISKKKIIPWLKIKAEYLQDVSPRDIAEKYGIKPKQVSDKALRDNWKQEKAKIKEETRKKTLEKIEELSNNALCTLSDIMNNPESKDSDRVAAAKAILDVSGLKSVKQEISGIDSNITVSINRQAVDVERD